MKLFGYDLTLKRSDNVSQSLENPRVSPYKWLTDLFATSSAAGVPVNEQIAMRYSTVYSCANVIASTLGTLPLNIFRELKSGTKELANDEPIAELLSLEPSNLSTSAYWRSVGWGHNQLWGNNYSRVIRTAGGEAKGFLPLMPDRVTPFIKDGELLYEILLEDGDKEILTSYEVLHVPAIGFDGIMGLSPVRTQMNAIGQGIAASEYGGRFFKNDARPGYVMEIPGRMKEAARDKLKESVEQNHKGLGKSHEMMILEEGVKIHEVGFPPAEAQFLETRQFSQVEICGIFLVPPPIIGIAEHVKVSNIEQMSLQFAKYCLIPLAVKQEQEWRRKLMRTGKTKGLYAKHDFNAFLRGDFLARNQAYALAVNNIGYLTPNEVRDAEDLPRADGLDKYRAPLNMTEAEKLGQSSENPKNPSINDGTINNGDNGNG
jgi:HK97 family phage portal protein